jgi:hypothetical protein
MRTAAKPRRWKWTTWVRLVLAGWRPNRDVWGTLRLPSSLAVFPSAQRVLAEFGGLKLGTRNDHMYIDPAFGEEVVDQVRAFEKKLQTRLYPVAIVEHQDREYVLIGENGLVYLLSGCEGRLWDLVPEASTFDREIDYYVQVFVRGYIRFRQRSLDDLRTHGLAGRQWRVTESELQSTTGSAGSCGA